MQWYEQTVTLLTGLAWPVAIGVIVWGFRTKIKGMLDRTGSLTLPGGVEWQAREIAEKEEELQAEVAESAPVLVPTESEPVEPTPSDPPVSRGNGNPTARPDVPVVHAPLGGSGQLTAGAMARSELVASQREAFEDVVRRAAEWGASRGRAGLGVEGTRVRWQADGTPRLVIPSVRHGFTGWTLEQELRSAEAKVEMLETELQHAELIDDAARANHAHAELAAARRRLEGLRKK